MGNRRRVVAIIVSVVVLAGLVVTGHRLWQARHRTDLSRALDVVPSSTSRLFFTDWSLVRSTLKVDLGADSTDAAIEAMINRAYEQDLSASSTIESSAVALQKYFGFSPATIDWEAYAQGDDGAAMVVRVPDGFDFKQVRERLTSSGFTEPKSASGVWKGGVDLVAGLDASLTPELQYVSVLADQHLIVTSDGEEYAAKAADVARGKGKSLGDVGQAHDVVKPLAEPAAATLWARDFACEDLAMSGHDEDGQVQADADALIAKAGKVTPLSGLVMALGADRGLRVSELFESPSDARTNLTSRARLAVGPAPGRTGSFSDDLELTSSKTDGSTVQLEFRPKSADVFPLSSLDSGPVLFATC